MNILKPKKVFRRHFFDLLAVAVLVIFFLISFPLIRHESATDDEQAHIPAAYSYVMLGDFTLNPEHPPLAKLVGGLGFIGSHYTYPTKLLHGNNKIGDREWQVGTAFLYHSGNNPDSILMRSRLPMLIASIIGLFISYLLFAAFSTKKIALIALIFTALAPTVIAHGHLVTTDIMVMTTMTIAILCFIRYLEKRSFLYGLIAGTTLAIAELSKFSAALLFVFYPLVAILFYYAKKPKTTKPRKSFKLMIKAILPTYVVALLIMYVVYAFQVIHLSHATQDTWIIEAAGGDPATHLGVRILLDINKVPILAPIVRYIVGFSSSLVRVEVGHGANLLAKNYATGTIFYFPVVSLLKTPLPLLALWISMAIYATKHIKTRLKSGEGRLNIFWRYIQTDPVPVFGILFTLIYLLVACTGSLDIGVRHMLPLFPWIAFLSALWVVRVLEKQTYKKFPVGKALSAGTIALFIFIALIIYPNYIPYTTELAGGAPQAYRYYNDSNVDWGQSIKYLSSYANTHSYILPLYTDQSYPDAKNYYFCGNTNSCSKLHILYNAQTPPKGSYFAVSETSLTIDWASPQDNLAFLKNEAPVAKIGDSIYLYHIQ